MDDKKVELAKDRIIENQKREMQTLAVENCSFGRQLNDARKEADLLKEELRMARSDNASLKEAIVNRFVSEWGNRG